jgi:GGDEF domain-containing protein
MAAAAFNHALFVCAGRLRRCVPQNVEMGRLGEDGFLLLVPNAQTAAAGPARAHVRERLAAPIVAQHEPRAGRPGTADDLGGRGRDRRAGHQHPVRPSQAWHGARHGAHRLELPQPAGLVRQAGRRSPTGTCRPPKPGA